MTDEGRQPALAPADPAPAPPPEPAVVLSAPEPVPAPVTEPAPPAAEVPAPAIPAEAVKEIGEVITDAVQAAITSDAEPKAQETTPPTPHVPTPEAPSPTQKPQESASPQPKSSAGARMRQVVRGRKQARLEKVMEMAVQKRVIVNDDAEKLLKVSDATASRYLAELVKVGRLRRSGAKFHERYEPLGGSNSAI